MGISVCFEEGFEAELDSIYNMLSRLFVPTYLFTQSPSGGSSPIRKLCFECFNSFHKALICS